MPQIAQLAETYASQIFWLLIFFGFTFFVVGKRLIPKVLDTIAFREEQIANDLRVAQSARDTADEQQASWLKLEQKNRDSAQALISQGKTAASKRIEKKVAAAQKRLDKKVSEAEERIAEARSLAILEVENMASEVTRDIVETIAGTSVPNTKIRAAVKKVINNV